MARPPVNIVEKGQRFGSLVVQRPDGLHIDRYRAAECLCDCGKTHVVRISLLLQGLSKSCGCMRNANPRKPASQPRVKKDLVGERFERLLVLRDSGQRNAKRAKLWVCACDCGVEKMIPTDALTSGISRSCGCLQKDLQSQRRSEDLTGGRFGSLVAVGVSQERVKASYLLWVCHCDCGNDVLVRSNHLKTGEVSTCGCSRDADISGRRFGKLVAIESVGVRGNARLWRCACDCGGERVARLGDIKAGMTISCGCAAKDKHVYMPQAARDRGAALGHARRARLKGAGGRFTPTQIQALGKKQRWRCAGPNCGVSLTKYGFHRDHRVAVAIGGSSDILNMELLCPDCNLRKGKKDPILWAQQHGLLI